MKNSFYFAHHGQTDWNVKGRLMGQQDPPLNEVGRQQAQAAAKILAGHSFATLCYSTAVRAKETALIIADECPCSLHPLEALKERTWGALEGQVVAAEQLVAAEKHLPNGAETLVEFQARVCYGMDQARVLPEPLLIVSHWGIYEIICGQLGLKSESFENSHVIYFFQELGHWHQKKLTD